MLKFLTSLFLMLFLMAGPLDARPDLDSLLQQLASATDTTRVNLLYDLHNEYVDESPRKAIEYLEQSLKLADELRYTNGIVNALAGMANVYTLQGNYTKAIECYLKAIPLRELQGNALKVASCLNNIGEIYRRQGNYTQALDYHLKSLKIKEAAGNQSGIASSLNNIGLIYIAQHNYQGALDFYLRALKIRETIDDKPGIAQSYNNIGEVFLAQHKTERALAYYTRSLKINEGLNNREGVAINYNSIGEIYEVKKYYMHALQNYNRALEINRELGDKRGIAILSHYIARVYAALDEPARAIELNNRSLELAREIGLKEEIRNVYENLHHLYAKMKQPEKAYEYLQLYVQMKDSLMMEENAKKLVDLQASYAFEQNQSQIKLLTQEKEIGLLVRNALVTGLGLLIGIALIFYRTSSQRKKANRQLRIQKAEIESQSQEIMLQRDVIAHKNKDIESSIRYARRIQNALLPKQSQISQVFPRHFVFYKPRDIVSGDFYWFSHIQAADVHKAVIAVVDCTGHGVPGAFMSMIGESALSYIVNDQKILRADLILNEMHKRVRTALHQEEGENGDGMDIALCVIDFKTRTLEYAGGNNPLVLVTGNQLEEIKADRFAIGGFQKEKERVFTRHEFKLDQPTTLYLFSDGYQDQFGGEQDRKFSFKRMKTLLSEIHHLDMEQQKQTLHDTIEQWKGGKNQIDDMLVMGVKISEQSSVNSHQ